MRCVQHQRLFTETALTFWTLGFVPLMMAPKRWTLKYTFRKCQNQSQKTEHGSMFNMFWKGGAQATWALKYSQGWNKYNT